MDMDQYILKELEGDFIWEDRSVEAPNPSPFVPYTNRPITEAGSAKSPNYGSNSMNVNKRMLQFLRKSWSPTTARTEIGETNGKERGFRHMINERMRREKQKQCYSALHSMLPIGSKSDKNWIVQMAATNIQQLQRYKEELRKRNMELEAILVANEKERANWSKIRLRVANPASGIDSMLEVIKCLQYLGLKARNVQSDFSPEEFSAELEIETKIGAAGIEEAMQEALYAAERKLRCSFSFP